MSLTTKILKAAKNELPLLVTTAVAAVAMVGSYHYQKKKSKERKEKRDEFEAKKRSYIEENSVQPMVYDLTIRNKEIKSNGEKELALKIMKRDFDNLLNARTQREFDDAKSRFNLDAGLLKSGTKDDISALLYAERVRMEEAENDAAQKRDDLALEREYKIKMNQVELVRKENALDRENDLEKVKLITDAIRSVTDMNRSPNQINIEMPSKRKGED